MNFTLIFFLVLFAIIVTMGAVIYVLAKSNKANKKELVQTQARLESARANVQQLSEYVDKLQKIKSEEKSISNKIKEAKTDEEVFQIIADIVADNNNRVQND